METSTAAQDKANELIERFLKYVIVDVDMEKGEESEDAEWNNAKACALICVEEIIDTIQYMAESNEPDKMPFWEEVKQILTQ